MPATELVKMLQQQQAGNISYKNQSLKFSNVMDVLCISYKQNLNGKNRGGRRRNQGNYNQKMTNDLVILMAEH